MEEIKEIIKDTISNLTQSQNVTDQILRPPASKEGMAVAYGSLVLMAVFPVFFGATRSVKFHKSEVKKEKVGESSYCLP